MKVIDEIVSAISSVDGVKLLNVDPGEGTNRTVVTFVGEPEAIVEAAFRGVKVAAELIDMSKHSGEHPRFGATDVLPLIPIAGISMEEVVEYARRLAKRIGEELGISVYCYGEAAFSLKRRELSYCRAGQYEGLPGKLAARDGKPDFGPSLLNVKSGASAVGARDFLIAYNVNLNTTDVRIANQIAACVRESGRKMYRSHKPNREILGDPIAHEQIIPGTLMSVKAIGWYIEEYGKAQVSMNLTNINVTPLHRAYEEVCRTAAKFGVKVTGSEIVGLVPLRCMLEAGKYFLQNQKMEVGEFTHQVLVDTAIDCLGLSEFYKFKPEKKIIEYVMSEKKAGKN
jgi:glutamate formiminotransferase/formiminotetrahydrofolate cyclodeaminase